MNFRSAIGACCISLIAAVGTQAAVDDYGDLITISELQAKFERTGDKTYQHFVQARCAAVTFNVANVFVQAHFVYINLATRHNWNVIKSTGFPYQKCFIVG